MKTTEIVGFNREDLGKKFSKQLRADGNVPCVLYGGKDVMHFYAPAYLFKDLIYTPDAYIVHLNIEGVEKKCVIKDAQFHPVSELLLHCDFLEIFDDKPVMLDIPVSLKGKSPGVALGGQIYVKSKKLKVKAIPANLPDNIEVDISDVKLGAAKRVKDLPEAEYEIITKPSVSIVQIIIPRALKAAGAVGDEDEDETVEGAEGEAPAEEKAEA